jgi:hypothetical protein
MAPNVFIARMSEARLFLYSKMRRKRQLTSMAPYSVMIPRVERDRKNLLVRSMFVKERRREKLERASDILSIGSGYCKHT